MPRRRASPWPLLGLLMPLPIGLTAASCRSAPASPAAAPQARAVPAARQAEAAAPFSLALGPRRVELDGILVGLIEPGVLERVEPLFQVLEARRRPSPGGAAPAYRISAKNEIDVAQFKSVLQTAAFAGYTRAFLDTGAGSVELSARVPALPSQDSQPSYQGWPEQTLALALKADALQLWRVPSEEAKPPAAVSPPVRLIAMAELERELPPSLRDGCARASCEKVLVFAENTVSYGVLRRALAELVRVQPAGVTPLVELRMTEWPSPTLALRSSLTTSQARLPAQAIQQRVRKNFGVFKACYVAGLAQNDQLEGRVTIRFVIGRDGSVSKAAVEASLTTLPDKAVVECVRASFEKLSFPEPDGGIVTVVYPILLSPG